MNAVPCPFVYHDGRKCPGHIVQVKLREASLEWAWRSGDWRFDWKLPKAPFELTCSVGGDHRMHDADNASQMSLPLDKVPSELWRVLKQARQD